MIYGLIGFIVGIFVTLICTKKIVVYEDHLKEKIKDVITDYAGVAKADEALCLKLAQEIKAEFKL